MNEEDFPSLYKSADTYSSKSQVNFFLAIKCHLILLILAAILSVVNIQHWLAAIFQVFALLGALACSVYLFAIRPERYWYAGRAVAESIKTIAWRYACRAEPFQDEDALARSKFQLKLKAIIEQNKLFAGELVNSLEGVQISNEMNRIRNLSLVDRRALYAKGRIKNQFEWYAKKSSLNKKAANKFFAVLILINVFAIACSILKIRFIDTPLWPTDIFVAAAACLLSWIQAKRFSELSTSYALAAHEIGLIRENSLLPENDEEFSLFVGDAENAFSREHTQWVARKDA